MKRRRELLSEKGARVCVFFFGGGMGGQGVAWRGEGLELVMIKGMDY